MEPGKNGKVLGKKGYHKIIRDICNLCDYPRVNGFWSFGSSACLYVSYDIDAYVMHMRLFEELV